jgi:hypothetical protein
VTHFLDILRKEDEEERGGSRQLQSLGKLEASEQSRKSERKQPRTDWAGRARSASVEVPRGGEDRHKEPGVGTDPGDAASGDIEGTDAAAVLNSRRSPPLSSVQPTGDW